MAKHWDIRLVCPITGELEATEDIGYRSLERAQENLHLFLDIPAKYRIVECSEPGSAVCHDVDMAVYLHERDHMGYDDTELVHWVGAPTDVLIPDPPTEVYTSSTGSFVYARGVGNFEGWTSWPNKPDGYRLARRLHGERNVTLVYVETLEDRELLLSFTGWR